MCCPRPPPGRAPPRRLRLAAAPVVAKGQGGHSDGSSGTGHRNVGGRLWWCCRRHGVRRGWAGGRRVAGGPPTAPQALVHPPQVVAPTPPHGESSTAALVAPTVSGPPRSRPWPWLAPRGHRRGGATWGPPSPSPAALPSFSKALCLAAFSQPSCCLCLAGSGPRADRGGPPPNTQTRPTTPPWLPTKPRGGRQLARPGDTAERGRHEPSHKKQSSPRPSVRGGGGAPL